MEGRHISCAGCKTHLGWIRDATLKKGLVYFCKHCETRRVASDMKRRPVNDKYEADLLTKLFGENVRNGW